MGERLPIVRALAGVAVAAYLASYQWDLLGSVWEPFSGDGSRVVLDSSVSHVLPIPDAALGAAGYLLDAVTGVVGGRARWRRMPRLAVGSAGCGSVVLVILQAITFDSFCTQCLAWA